MARPRGSKDTKPRKTPARIMAAQANAAGVTPLEILLGTMRKAWAARDTDRACVLAEKAAPYCHARLSSQQINANIHRSPSDYSDAELAALAGEGEDGGEDGVGSASGRPN